MRFSCIVPAYNEEKFIARTLASIRNQTFRDYELLVVLRPSEDRTEEIARSYADSIIIHGERGVGAARNVGALNSKGEIIVFIDADTIIPPTFLEDLDKIYRSESVTSAVPRFRVYDGSLKGSIVYTMLDMLIRVVSKVKFLLYGMLISIRRDSFLSFNGFSNIFGEDIDLAFKISKKYRINRNRIIKYCPKLVAYTSSRRIKQLGFWKALKLWIENLSRRFLFEKPFVGYLGDTC